MADAIAPHHPTNSAGCRRRHILEHAGLQVERAVGVLCGLQAPCGILSRSGCHHRLYGGIVCLPNQQRSHSVSLRLPVATGLNSKNGAIPHAAEPGKAGGEEKKKLVKIIIVPLPEVTRLRVLFLTPYPSIRPFQQPRSQCPQMRGILVIFLQGFQCF